MNFDPMPKPTDLFDNPQLAIIVALETTLVAAIRALLAAHTDMLDDVFPRTVREQDVWADRLIFLGGDLVNVLGKYRDAVLEKTLPGAEDF